MVEFFAVLLFLLTIMFPIFHIINAIYASKGKKQQTTGIISEKGISILIPCYNEESIIQTTIDSIEKMPYKAAEYIFINDGSTDKTMMALFNLLELKIVYKDYPLTRLEFMPIKNIYKSEKFPNIMVIDKVNGGKADALNAGIILATHELIITLDADSILDDQALSIINEKFEDESIIAAGGMVQILQGSRRSGNKLMPSLKSKLIVRLQLLEYLRGFYVYKASLARSNALSIISGAFGVFRKEVLLEVNGYRKTVGEDIDITLKIQKYLESKKGSRVVFIPEACCYTEVPETWKDLYNQRIRWQKAFTDCLVIYHKDYCKSIFSKKLPFFFLIDSFFVGVVCSYLFLMSILPIIFNVGHINSEFVMLYLIISTCSNLTYSIVSIWIARKYSFILPVSEKTKLANTIILDLLLFRFLNILVICIGTIAYFIKKEGWNKVARTGRDYSVEQAS
ncbi:glycosyltransferase family 2 protein [Sutcliffiella horikoshii]|uniref:glycosyltransferase family 2 protein n=1 Tax=Sutcliffiella horikoshii TaxID=79883 RepID=UPI001CFE5E42|nr:glycosyltransferase [Sutcliffiella horikoshii]